MELRHVSRKNREDKVVKINNNTSIGSGDFTIIAGPCAVESEEQIFSIAKYINSLDIEILRGGAFKPRTSPYSFQGLGFEGLKLLKKAAKKYNLNIISEIMDPRDVEKAYDFIDIYQIGSRNMQNFALLKEVGKTDKPVMLKRGMTATVKEWLMAAEYIALEGNDNIILCERGIRTFENYTRNTLDLTVVPILKSLTHLPVIVDPSHGTGKTELVIPMARAAAAVGADGVMVETHPSPCDALSDGYQSLDFEQLKKLRKEVNIIKKCVDKLD
ncbi:bifunctional 3-deoxy-7-phosphoheptulonate synthase/chorismate mutase [Thermohalobacter berrensis]|uniref:3-deoxy-7-phosphoheptulonate synthase n=1 Tax=Thermohalobacter berrensis TaxID=99594 RepID=A0A419TA45_9FIRM|nr:bifunctional 3-deoxy-7-phosphoheptulonate synthase/chorismate mutase [Thermohalobacter berrensis]RKD34335.1 3-deoxy-7-phosphoheptulonate synthase [Thermohalobacter berrensis]